MRRNYKGLDNRDLKLRNISHRDELLLRHGYTVFIVNRCDSVQEAARKLRVKLTALRSRIAWLRRNGIEIKMFRPARIERLLVQQVIDANPAPPDRRYERVIKIIQVWQTAKTRAEAARILNTSDRSLSARISKFRSMGVMGLRRFRKWRSAEGLSEIASAALIKKNGRF